VRPAVAGGALHRWSVGWVERGESATDAERSEFGVQLVDGVADLLARPLAPVGARPGVGGVQVRAGGHELLLLGGRRGPGRDGFVLEVPSLPALGHPQPAGLVRARPGHGYDEAHRAALVQLQQAQRRARNVKGGYWIAETDPAAAHHALTSTVGRDGIEWAVLATDGAADVIEHAGHRWHRIAQYDNAQLDALLARIHEWEDTSDPDGRHLPRAKQHDDKTIAALASIWA